MRYAFIQDNQHIWSVRRLCSTLDIHYNGYYAWLKRPISKTARKRQQLSGLIKQFWLESGEVYGYRKIHCDLKDVGESCGINRVHRLMKANGLKSQRGYHKPKAYAGPTGSPLYSQIINIVSFSPANAGIPAIGTSIANTRNRSSNAIGYASNNLNGWTYRARCYSDEGAMMNFWDGENYALDLGADFRNDKLRFSVGYSKDWSDKNNALDYKWQTGIRLNAYKPIQPYVLLGRDTYATDHVDYLIAGTKFSKDKHSVVLNYAQRDILNQNKAVFRKQQVSYLYDVNKQLNLNISYNRDDCDYGDRNVISKGFGVGWKYDFNLFRWQ